MNRITAVRVAAELSRCTGMPCRRLPDNTIEVRTPRGQLVGICSEQLPLDASGLLRTVHDNMTAIIETL